MRERDGVRISCQEPTETRHTQRLSDGAHSHFRWFTVLSKSFTIVLCLIDYDMQMKIGREVM